MIAMQTPSARYCYHFNPTGHTVALTDMTGAVVNSYAYDPFGNILGEQETIAQPFKYVGQYGVMAEPDGLYYMRARYYDPAVGRFISEDPIGFEGWDTNLFAYVGNSPISFSDPVGLFKLRFDEGISSADQKFIENAFFQLHDSVKNNQRAIDFYKRFGIDIVKDSSPSEGPCLDIKVNRGKNYHAQYVNNTIFFYNRAFINAKHALYTVGHELGHWARDMARGEVWLGISNYPVLSPDPEDRDYGYGAELATYGNILWPDGKVR